MTKKQRNLYNLPLATVIQKVENYLNQNKKKGNLFKLFGTPTVVNKTWSTLYFFSLADTNTKIDLAAKIVRFPHQESTSVSWESEELITYSRLEYKTLNLVHDHYLGKEKHKLYTIKPLGHIPENSILVMEYLEGQSLKSVLNKTRNVLGFSDNQKVIMLLEKVGLWLRHFHHLLISEQWSKKTFSPKDTYKELLEKNNKLSELGIDFTKLVNWQHALKKIEYLTQEKTVWAHGDFHPRNLIVMPNLGIAGIDIALEMVTSPYYDIGRFISEFKTRRISRLSFGMIPSQKTLKKHRDSFLKGYFQNEEYDNYKILLFEGDLFLQNWLETLEKFNKFQISKIDRISTIIKKLFINPIYFNILRKWIKELMADENREVGK